jgi:hypothetical protein
MSAPENAPVILHADQEHSGIRLAVFIGLFVGFLLGFRLVALALETLAPRGWQDYVPFLSCVGALPIALGFIWGLERFLKRVWHSGLSIALDPRGLFVDDRRDGAKPRPADEPAMTWSANMSQLRWYFRLSGYARGGRERRVPAKWLCLAAELQQDEARLSVYTFMPPDKAAVWIETPRQGFHFINQAELYQSSARSRFGPPVRPTIPQHLLQTKDARYWLAERRRWEFGIELTPDDFATLLGFADRGARESVPLTN